MATTSFNHSLLVSPEKRSSKPICKTIFLTISLVAIVSLASFVAFHITTNNHLPVCATAGNPTACLAIISKEIAASLQPTTKFELLQLLLKRSVAAAAAASHAARLLNLKINDPRQQSALSDCVELMDLSRDRLDESSMALLQRPMTSKSHSDVHSWLSAVLTNHVTCVDGLHGQAKSSMKPDMDNLVALASTSLAIVSSVSPPADGDHQTLLTTMNEYPSWLGFKDRSLLEARAKAIQANVVVAKDGSGKYRTVQEGVDSAPDNGATRYVIYVKRGVYKEQVAIGKKKKNVMLVGDGMDSTIITGSLNVVDGSTTFNSATVGNIYIYASSLNN